MREPREQRGERQRTDRGVGEQPKRTCAACVPHQPVPDEREQRTDGDAGNIRRDVGPGRCAARQARLRDLEADRQGGAEHERDAEAAGPAAIVRSCVGEHRAERHVRDHVREDVGARIAEQARPEERRLRARPATAVSERQVREAERVEDECGEDDLRIAAHGGGAGPKRRSIAALGRRRRRARVGPRCGAPRIPRWRPRQSVSHCPEDLLRPSCRQRGPRWRPRPDSRVRDAAGARSGGAGEPPGASAGKKERPDVGRCREEERDDQRSRR